MRQANDTKTPDILGDTCDLAGPVPPPVNKAALRAARFRERHGVKSLTVNIPVAQLLAFEEYCKAKDRKKSDVIAKLIESQLLRKR